MRINSRLMVAMSALTLAIPLSSCGGEVTSDTFNYSEEITTVSREDGSGTRGAFGELFGIIVKDGDTESDNTYEEAIIANKTDVVMTNVSSYAYAIGYISLGSLNDTLKAVSIDGVEATAENIANGSYAAFRPFLIVTSNNQSELALDFEKYILSAEGQAIIGKSYIAYDENPVGYTGGGLSGKISVGGSTSVSPIMEKLVESYQELNPEVTIDIQATGSSAGISGVMDGTVDIGMSSRDLKEAEAAEVNGITIAYDGIAVIVNNNNPVDNLTSEEVNAIFTGEVTDWTFGIK